MEDLNVFDQIIQFANIAKVQAQSIANKFHVPVKEANDSQLEVFFDNLKVLIGNEKLKTLLKFVEPA